jgi:hypothetical protein
MKKPIKYKLTTLIDASITGYPMIDPRLHADLTPSLMAFTSSPSSNSAFFSAVDHKSTSYS